jgi:hypothetical protein
MIDFLYYFESDDYCLIETKRTDLPSDAALSEIYKWLIFDGKSEKFEVLGFRSMVKEENREKRSFTQGELQFDKEQAEFFYHDKNIKLTNGGPDSISDELKVKTSSYLLNLI